jgi:hypothetical protein
MVLHQPVDVAPWAVHAQPGAHDLASVLVATASNFLCPVHSDLSNWVSPTTVLFLICTDARMVEITTDIGDFQLNTGRHL